MIQLSFKGSMRYTVLVLSVIGLTFLAACTGGGKARVIDTPTSGQINVAVDESLGPLIRTTSDTFQATYTEANIGLEATSEGEAMAMLMKDSARLAVVSRRFNEQEKAYFKKRNITQHEYEYAVDGVAVIVHKSNMDTLMSLASLGDILMGRKVGGKKLVAVVDKANSSNLRFLETRLQLKDVSASVFSAGSNKGVLEYVTTHPEAIGFIGLNWISDSDNPGSVQFRKNVHACSLSEQAEPTDANSFAPYQAYLATKDYPLRRAVYILSREARTGLGTGFVSWAISEKGQRIVLKAGLLPSTMPIRLVNLRKSDDLAQ
jgi:phosphate transport system substrate-binding protein